MSILIDKPITKNQFKEEVSKTYDNKIPERILNEDNPQYILGWNACRYLSKSVLSQKLDEIVELAFRECEIKKKDESGDWSKKGYNEELRVQGFNSCIDERSKLEKKFLEN